MEMNQVKFETKASEVIVDILKFQYNEESKRKDKEGKEIITPEKLVLKADIINNFGKLESIDIKVKDCNVKVETLNKSLRGKLFKIENLYLFSPEKFKNYYSMSGEEFNKLVKES